MEEYLQIIQTKDGSDSLLRTDLGETYHSRHGAEMESNHVFIQAGLQYLDERLGRINLLEIGFGTGLNALLTLAANEKHKKLIYYVGMEPQPIPLSIAKRLNYAHLDARMNVLHDAPWNVDTPITGDFILHKAQQKILDFNSEQQFHLIYFDAFGPATQPDMWTEEMFIHLYKLMAAGGVLTTYCAKGEVRRTMQRIGFLTERLPGPPGKREMLRATKPKQ